MAKELSKQVSLEGFAEFKIILQNLPDDLRNKALYDIEMQGARIIQKEARSKLSGLGKGYGKRNASIIVKRGKNKHNPSVWIGPAAGRKYGQKDFWFARFVEFGVSGVKKKVGGNKNPQEFGWVKRIKKGARYRPDQPAMPFMMPTIENSQPAIEKNFRVYLARAIVKIGKKYAPKYFK